jgi:anti-sigma factor RsiW
MKITRNVIQDLLPLYVSGEASPDTVALVEKYLETDSELDRMAKEMAAMDLSAVPAPLSKEEEMKSYERMYMLRTQKTVLMTTIILGSVLCALLIVPLIYMLVIR